MNVDGQPLDCVIFWWLSGEHPLDVILHKYRQAVVFVAGECEAWEFQGGVVLLVGFLEQYTTLALVVEVRCSRTSRFGSKRPSTLR